jgi:pilus assembly protein CpaB
MKLKWPHIMLVTAIGLGLVTTYLVNRWMEKQSGARSTTSQEHVLVKPVVVAALDLVPGTKIRPETLNVINWPAQSMPAGAISDPNTLSDRVVLLRMVSGEPVMESKLAPPGSGGGLTTIITPGKRAMSVRVDEIIGVAGFVVPGSYVDVLVTIDDKNHPKLGSAAQTILQHIKVLTSGQKIVNEKNQPVLVNVVTLELTPEETEKLALASNRGRLQLALRNEWDDKETKTFAIHVPQLITSPPQLFTVKSPKQAPRRPFTVEVIRGNKRTHQEL